jgi:Phosphotransferase enzyme family
MTKVAGASLAVAPSAHRVPPVVGLAAHLGRGIQRVATDAVVGRVRSLPRRVEDLDAAFLSRIMNRTVTSVSVLGGDAGTSSRARIALTGENVPDSVFVKMPAETAATRLMGEVGRLGDTEVHFYRDLSPELTGVPKTYGSAFDSLTGRFVIVLEDLPVEQCEFPDTLHPLDRDKASLIVESLARLHGTFWGRLPDNSGSGLTGQLGWLYSASDDSSSLLTGPLLKVSARRIAERTSIPVETGRFIDENYRAIAHLIDTAPHTVMHGDAHPGNVYFRNGEAGLLDWQAVRRGHPSRELAYTLITSMTTTDRQASERDLLDTYRKALVAAGGPELDRDDLWDRYRQSALYAYVAPLITAGMGGMQEEGIAMEGLKRGVAALDDLDTVAQLKKAL